MASTPPHIITTVQASATNGDPDQRGADVVDRRADLAGVDGGLAPGDDVDEVVDEGAAGEQAHGHQQAERAADQPEHRGHDPEPGRAGGACPNGGCLNGGCP